MNNKMFLQPRGAFFFALSAACFANAFANHDGVSNVLRYLSWSQGVRMVTSESLKESGVMVEVARNLCKGGILVLLPGKQENSAGDHCHLLPIVFLSYNVSDVSQFLQILTHDKYPSEGFLLVTSYSLDEASRNLIKTAGYSRAFFHFALNQDPKSIERLQTFRTKDNLVSMTWYLDEETGKFKREFDFHGAAMTMITPQNYWPYIYVIPRPDDPRRGAAAQGINIDIMAYMTKRFNFTYEIYILESGDWGMQTLSGEFGDPNANYTGIIKEMLDDKYDRSSSAFFMETNRKNLFDFSIEYWFVRLVYLTDLGKATKPDWTLYIRPFTRLAWLSSLTMLAIALGCYHLVSRLWLRLYGMENDNHSLRLMAFVGWMCYLLTEIYWEGALTMFFTTESNMPFDSLEEMLQDYPYSKFVLAAPHAGTFYYFQQIGVKGMDEQIKRIETDPEIVAPDFPTWLKSLKKPGRVTFAVPGEVRLYMELYGIKDLNLERIWPHDSALSRYALIFPKRTPWKEAFNMGYAEMMSSGQMDQLKRSALPEDLLPAPVDLKEELNLRQTALVFLMLGGMQVLALVVFLGEWITRKTGGGRDQRQAFSE